MSDDHKDRSMYKSLMNEYPKKQQEKEDKLPTIFA